MNADAALARLSRMLQNDIEPVLSDETLIELFSYAAIPDADRNAVDHEAWAPTYSTIWLNAAAAEGWRAKAARLGAGETFSADGFSAHPEERRDFCLAMAKEYDKRVGGTMGLPGRTAQGADRIDTGILVN
jgi:hypothetical protein